MKPFEGLKGCFFKRRRPRLKTKQMQATGRSFRRHSVRSLQRGVTVQEFYFLRVTVSRFFAVNIFSSRRRASPLFKGRKLADGALWQTGNRCMETRLHLLERIRRYGT